MNILQGLRSQAVSLATREASVVLSERASLGPASVKEGDITWDEERGWTTISGKTREQRSFQQFVEHGFRGNAVVRACANEIATSISEAPIRAYKKSDDHRDGWERIDDHPAEKLFENPNSRDDYVRFIERSMQHFLIGGNNFWRKRYTTGGYVDTLLPVSPARVISAITDDDDVPLAFKILRNLRGSEMETVPADEILHVPDVDPLNDVFGLPRLLACASDMMSDNKATRYVSETLSNHGVPALLIGVPNHVEPWQLDRAEERFRDKFGPGRGRGKTGFLPSTQSVHEIGFSLRELEFPDLRRVSGERICAVMGPVDPIIVGIASASKGGTLSGAEAQSALTRLWVQALIPMLRRFESAMNAHLSWEWGDIRLFFAIEEIAALQPDRKSDIDRGKVMADTGAYTEEEIRTEAGFDPEMDPTGTLLRTLQYVSIPVDQRIDDGSSEIDGAGADGSGDAPPPAAGSGKERDRALRALRKNATRPLQQIETLARLWSRYRAINSRT